MLVIADAASPSPSPASWAARIPRCSDDTRDILLECALFDPRSVRARGARSGSARTRATASSAASIRTDADGAPPRGRAHRATAGGTVEPERRSGRAGLPPPPADPLRPARVEQVLGETFTAERSPRCWPARLPVSTAGATR
jgi:phenylalanyl-tRNA synthetase beta subunit